jgi:hypothetical protein
MLTPYEIDRRLERQALKSGTLTPQHSAAEGAIGDADAEEDAEERRRRVQHLADPLAEPAMLPEVAEADLDKVYQQAFGVPSAHPAPREAPWPRRVSPEEFRRGPITGGEAAYSAGYGEERVSVPVPSAALSPGMISRPPLADGQSRPCAPEAC